MNQKLKTMKGPHLLSWLKDKSAILLDCLSIFVGVLRKKSLDYTCFQYFNQPDYAIFLGTMMELIGILLPYLEVASLNNPVVPF